MNSRTLTIIAIACVLIVGAVVTWVDFGIAFTEISSESQVSTTTASTEGRAFHPDPLVIAEVRAETMNESLLHEELRGALSDVAGLTVVDRESAPDETPVLRVNASRSGLYTSVYSRPSLDAEWHYASDGNIEGLLQGEVITFHGGEDPIRRISGDTTIDVMMYGVFTRRHFERRVAEVIARELVGELHDHLSP